MNKSSIVFIALIALAVGFGASWYVADKRPIELESGLWFGEQARALPEFALIDHNGETLDPARLADEWSLLFFGYTHCPDICPISLQTLADMMKTIDDPHVRDRIQVYFVSVDPERDTPELMARYVTYFDPDFIGATAAMDGLRVLTRSLGIAHEFRNRSEGNPVYDVDHSGSIVLIAPDAKYAGLFGAPQDAQKMARDMTRIVERH